MDRAKKEFLKGFCLPDGRSWYTGWCIWIRSEILFCACLIMVFWKVSLRPGYRGTPKPIQNLPKRSSSAGGSSQPHDRGGAERSGPQRRFSAVCGREASDVGLNRAFTFPHRTVIFVNVPVPLGAHLRCSGGGLTLVNVTQGHEVKHHRLCLLVSCWG